MVIVEYANGGDRVRELIKQAGTTIGSVEFTTRKNGKPRRMTYRLKVQNPKFAKKPGEGKKTNKTAVDLKNNQMTVLDVNVNLRDDDGKIIGRGGWRTIPLERVTSIKNHGVKYEIHR